MDNSVNDMQPLDAAADAPQAAQLETNEFVDFDMEAIAAAAQQEVQNLMVLLPEEDDQLEPNQVDMLMSA